MIVLDPRLYSTAARDAVKAAVPASTNVYDYSTVPGTNGNSGTVPLSFVIVAVERRYNPNLRQTAQAGATGWRLSVRCVASSVSNASLLLFGVSNALNEKRLTINGTATTPIQFESDQTPEYDSGRFAALSLWTFAH